MMSSFWRDRTTLVTGSTGFLGGWLTRRLCELGADVVCLIRDWVPQCELVQTQLIEQIKVVRGDVLDRNLLERILGEYEIDTVFHLAAQTIVGIANRNPLSTFETNIQGTWALLEACRRTPSIKQIVLASSDKAYGSQSNLAYNESTPLQGQHPYDVSKSCADLIAQTYACTYQAPVAITRCGNFYGGGDFNWNRIVPGTIRSILRGQRPVIRSNGEYVRDYFYIEDAVAAYLLLAEQLAERKELCGQAFNFSNEIPLTVLQLTQMILQQMDSNVKPEILNQATCEIAYQSLNSSKAHQLLNWKPLFTLDEGLKRTIDWYKGYFACEPELENSKRKNY